MYDEKLFCIMKCINCNLMKVLTKIIYYFCKEYCSTLEVQKFIICWNLYVT